MFVITVFYCICIKLSILLPLICWNWYVYIHLYAQLFNRNSIGIEKFYSYSTIYIVYLYIVGVEFFDIWLIQRLIDKNSGVGGPRIPVGIGVLWDGFPLARSRISSTFVNKNIVLADKTWKMVWNLDNPNSVSAIRQWQKAS